MNATGESVFLQRIAVGPLMVNSYLLGPVSPTFGNEAVLIDPGGEADRLIEAVERSERRLAAILLTHAHFDHVGALAELDDRYGLPIYLHPADRVLLEHAESSAAQWGVNLRQPLVETLSLEHGQELELAGMRLRCLHTPGHAPGHVAFQLADANLVIAGDALFRGSIGRTDLPLANHEQLIASIRRELLTLPGETVVWPGHGPETTVAQEKLDNPFLR